QPLPQAVIVGDQGRAGRRGLGQALRLGVVAAVEGGQQQRQALPGGQLLVVPGEGGGVHRSWSFRPVSTACRASVRLSVTSTPMARNRASARLAVRRDFSAVDSSAASTCRSLSASSFTTSPVPIGEASLTSRGGSALARW